MAPNVVLDKFYSDSSIVVDDNGKPSLRKQKVEV
jgi:hypothetical protein